MALVHESAKYPITDVFIRIPNDEENERLWQEFRMGQKQTTIGASALAGFLGAGYNGTRASIENHLSDLPFTAICGEYVCALMDHGVEMEPKAIEYINKHYAMLCGIERVLPPDGKERSYRHDVSTLCGGADFNLLATPDYCGTDCVVEIKCPAYHLKRGYKPVDALFAEVRKYPFGRHNHFIQAATYAHIRGNEYFYVMKYFWINQEEHVHQEAAVMIQYKMTDELHHFIEVCIYHAFYNIYLYLTKEPSERRRMRFKNLKKEMQEMTESCFINAFPSIDGRIHSFKPTKQ